ncbi:hypothetical protein [Psychrobacter sp. I-STPA6b]|uniref:hypothetical protein n=1 Tax=Psychrobacter sp. I-STPA6b TaxID=2585718 RepID=UPI001D0C7208|nr:hypothetical protein [Psychrobacter sp. I-STPA6b]
MIMTISASMLLFGCQPASDSTPVEDSTTSAHSDSSQKAISTEATANTNNSNRTDIDWTKLDSKISPVNPEDFKYPFELDSQSVLAYADFFHITPAEARHSLTIGTASNEPLPELLDQLGDHYRSHELTDGKDVTLIIHTSPEVTASRYDYVFSEPFAQGLTMPIIIQPKSTTQAETTQSKTESPDNP